MATGILVLDTLDKIMQPAVKVVEMVVVVVKAFVKPAHPMELALALVCFSVKHPTPKKS